MGDKVNRQWRLKSRPVGMPTRENFDWTEESVAEIKDGQVLIRNLYFSFDPTQRGWMAGPTYLPAIEIGEVMRAGAVGQVIESKNPGFEAGDFVNGGLGWQDSCIEDGTGPMGLQKIPPGVPIPMAMSVMGLTGVTAYFGMLDVAEPKEGDTVVVSGAAGATGSIAAQIAKIKGARVIGIAGGPDKCAWLKEVAGLDAVIDYKNENIGEALDKHCPKGINVYFDNVGGEILNECLARLALNARIAVCGAIASYNDETPPPGPSNYMNLVIMRSKMEGFLVLDYLDRFGEAAMQLGQWVMSGDIKFQVDIQEGIENAPETFTRLFTGKNLGKQLLRVAEAPLGGETPMPAG